MKCPAAGWSTSCRRSAAAPAAEPVAAVGPVAVGLEPVADALGLELAAAVLAELVAALVELEAVALGDAELVAVVLVAAAAAAAGVAVGPLAADSSSTARRSFGAEWLHRRHRRRRPLPLQLSASWRISETTPRVA